MLGLGMPQAGHGPLHFRTFEGSASIQNPQKSESGRSVAGGRRLAENAASVVPGRAAYGRREVQARDMQAPANPKSRAMPANHCVTSRGVVRNPTELPRSR